MPYDKDEHFEVLKEIPVHDCLVFGTIFVEYFNPGFEIKDISNLPLLMLKKLSHVRHLLDVYAGENGINFSPLFEFDSTDLLIKFAKINMGIAFAIEEFVEKEIDNKTIFLRRLNPQINNRAIGMLKIKSIALSHAATKFAELILTDTVKISDD
jgi:DNA-binding transcriptional LysR family regulator